jgi:hypothetical protein
VGIRSQHFYAGFGHIVYLNRAGEVMRAQPDESQSGYRDIQLGGPRPIDLSADHRFEISLTESDFSIRVNDITRSFSLWLATRATPIVRARLSRCGWQGIGRTARTWPSP